MHSATLPHLPGEILKRLDTTSFLWMPDKGVWSNNQYPQYHAAGVVPAERPITLVFYYIAYTTSATLSSRRIPEMRRMSGVGKIFENMSCTVCILLRR